MEVTIEENGRHDRLMTVRVPASRVADLWGHEIDSLHRQARLPGFRPGKAPRSLVESRYAEQLRQELAERLVRETLDKALHEHAGHLVGRPAIRLGEVAARDQDFVYTVAYQVMPAVQAAGYQGMALTRMHYVVTDEAVDLVVQRIRENHATWETRPDRPAQLGDEVLLDFQGTMGGEPFAGGSDTNYPLELGRKRFIGDFEEQLVGIQVGETRQVTVTFPEKYPSANLAGQEAVFTCTAREVRERLLPAVDDSLAAKIGLKEGGVAAMLQDIRNRLEEEAAVESLRQLKQAIFGNLLASNPLDLPSQMVEEEVVDLKESLRQETKRQGGDPAAMDLDAPQYREQLVKGAQERLILGLTVGSIAATENIQVDDASLEAHLEEMTRQFGDQAEAVRDAVRKNKGRMEELRGRLLENRVVTWIIENGQVTDEERPFNELGQDQA